MNSTQLLYMEDSSLFFDQAKVVNCYAIENGKFVLILDSTIFYPQGGGQPYDQGFITNDSNVFEVQEVRFIENMVHHIGVLISGNFEKGMTVTCEVNEKRRMINSLIHSGGHVVDIGLYNLGYKLTPVKGYHFPDGPYIEYYEAIDREDDRNNLKNQLQEEVDALVSSNYPIYIKMVEKEYLHDMAKYIPTNIPLNKPLRAMIINGFPAIPCGGTHISSTGRLLSVIIENIKNVKGKLRVRYSVKYDGQ